MTDNRAAAIVLAAGKGTRMKSELPKVMHRIAGWPMTGRSVAGHVNGATLVTSRRSSPWRDSLRCFQRLPGRRTSPSRPHRRCRRRRGVPGGRPVPVVTLCLKDLRRGCSRRALHDDSTKTNSPPGANSVVSRSWLCFLPERQPRASVHRAVRLALKPAVRSPVSPFDDVDIFRIIAGSAAGFTL